jgi:hypothetical protein
MAPPHQRANDLIASDHFAPLTTNVCAIAIFALAESMHQATADNKTIAVGRPSNMR